MRRFITYMYEYERGIRGRNTGFIRTDLRDDGCRMQLQIRGLERFKGKCPVYLTVMDNNTLTAVPMTQILLSQGAGSCSFFCAGNKLGDSTFDIKQVQTLTVCCGNGKFLIGCLRTAPVPEALRGEFIIYAQPEPPFVTPQEEELPQEIPDDTPQEEEPPQEIPDDLPQEEEPPQEIPDDTPQTQEPSQQPPDAMPAPTESIPVPPAQEPVPEIPPQAAPSAPPPVQAFQQPERKTSPDASVEPEISYKKIEISDIRKLPKSNWNLCNNRFLIHGFFNYHYLMLKTVEMEGKTHSFLGVPGIYEQPERMMALLFGFPEFEAAEKRAQAASVEPAPGVFGYWMCPLT